MKKINALILILILFTALTTLAADELIFKTLSNGMQVAVKENHSNSSIGFYCFVKTGSNNEGRYLGAGISHYLEHVVSGGTTEFRTEDEYSRLGKEMGAIVNAYTSTDVTAYHIIVDKQYSEEALQILAEQVNRCDFSLKEIQREKEVILKEIVMRSTPVQAKIRQKFNELMFPQSNSRYPVIGYTELFKTITPEELEDYYHKRYVPNNMIFVAVGDFDAETMFTSVEETFSLYERRQIQPVYLPQQHLRSGTLEYIEEYQVEQPTVLMGTIIPPSNYKDAVALKAALDILFAKRKSPIRYKLTEELNLVNYIYGYSSASMNDSQGIIYISFEAKDVSKLNDIVSIIDDEILKYSKEGITEADIQNLISREKAGRLLSSPDVDSECNRIGWNIISYGVPDIYKNHLAQMEKLTVEDLQNVLRKHLVPQNRVIMYAVPEGTADQINTSEEIIVQKNEVEKHHIEKKLTLLHRYNNEKPLVRGIVYLPIDSNYENKENAGSLGFLTELMFSGSEHYKPLDLTEWCEDHSVRLRANTNLNGTTIDFKCLKDDLPEVERIIKDAFESPIFDQKEIDLAKDNITAHFKRTLSDAGSIHDDFRNSVLYAGKRGSLTEEARKDIIIGLTQSDLHNLYNDYFKAESAIITFYGDIDKETAEKSAKNIFKSVPKGKIKFPKEFSETPDLGTENINQYKFEQVNIDINYPAPTLMHDDFYAMKVLELLLSNMRGRIHNAVRGNENNLAYFAYATYGYSEGNGFLRLTSQTSIDKKEELKNVLIGEIEKLINEPVSQKEIEDTIYENSKMMQAMLTDNYLPSYITMFESLGLGYDFLQKRDAIYLTITPEDIQRVAQTYLKNPTVIISEPSEDIDLMVK